eukprot:6172369-Pleurochrysis_carterae.AAC.1
MSHLSHERMQYPRMNPGFLLHSPAAAHEEHAAASLSLHQALSREAATYVQPSTSRTIRCDISLRAMLDALDEQVGRSRKSMEDDYLPRVHLYMMIIRAHI